MELFIILVIGFCLYKVLMPSAPSEEIDTEQEESRPLTSTQRKWHAMKREREMKQIALHETEHVSKYEEVIRLQVEMQQYIIDHKRPFHPIVWLFDTINPRLHGEYIRKMIALGVIYGLIALFSGVFLTIGLLTGVLVMDYIFYDRQLMLEVTEWNPEFNEKFTKRFQALGIPLV